MHHSIQSLSRLAGITPDRLRTWERRYGVPRPARTAGGQRRYSDADARMVQRMAALIAGGVPASAAAAAAQSAEEAPSRSATAMFSSLHMPAVSMFEAVVALDGPALACAIRSAVAELGWARAMSEVVFPVLRDAGEAWHAGQLTPAHEHLLSETIRGEMLVAIGAMNAPGPESPLALLACPEGERHDLGLLALRYSLEVRGIRTLYLGADLPAAALARAVQSTRPHAVCLAASSAAGGVALSEACREVVAAAPATLLYVGGPGCDAIYPETVMRLPSDFDAAAEVVALATSGLCQARHA